ncbi:hypothetical protein PC129_g6698 [Phytophthora cactorum]|uniref:SET domain-containing protein n=1 Tax=Phytophthora cactorum TaxID=29920 RepID=A0A329RQD1_9STRA|nr:hypothetical protein PC112_g16589 [Phytophthora cactorum]KAG2893147.1 hypothetical protein PC114_g16349 [Phytophthora cactorum]KAG2906600.1 hypothetical protein PC115_g14231 [Phytophthora cactorum]KAG2923492.1 hypothetical protein PC117_g15722 [Phytophthora cactorum]KAG3003656.1 hypothetical protein PC119_g15881 [Phytophthora cactorum]
MRHKLRHHAKKRVWCVERASIKEEKCGVARSGTHIYHAHSLKVRKVQVLLELLGVLNRLRALHTRRPIYVEPRVDDDHVPNKGIRNYDMCKRYGDCLMDTCENVASAVCYTSDSCKLGVVCSNAPRSRSTLKLFDTGHVGIRVFTTMDLGVGNVAREYAGALCAYDDLQKEQTDLVLKLNSGHTMIYNTLSTKKKYVYVEAVGAGDKTRFISHACEPNAAFVELHNGANVKVLVRMIKGVKAGALITVSYGNDTWFKCACDKSWKETGNGQTTKE